jgi:hypothetical protein
VTGPAALALIEAIVDASRAAARIGVLLPIGVRHRQLKVSTLLAGMMLTLADDRPAHLTRVHQALTALPAGGFYHDAAGRLQAFVASQRNGHWIPAIEVRGTAAANVGGQAIVDSVSCSSPGNCAAGGYYEASAYNGNTATWQAFVVSQRSGKWGTAVPVLRTVSVNDNTPGAATDSVSCPARGSCAVAGAYVDRTGHVQAFTVTQRNGRWGKAVQAPGLSALNRGGSAQAFSVSCPSAGNCGAGGYYVDGHGRLQAFAATQRNGHWGKAIKVPGTAALNTGGYAALVSMSCPAVSRCSAGGYYKSSGLQAFVVSQTRR